jgi:hypothetical protein
MKKQRVSHREVPAPEAWNLLGFSHTIEDFQKITDIPRSTLSRWCACPPKGKQPIPGVHRDARGRWAVRMGPELDQWVARYHRQATPSVDVCWLTSSEVQRLTGASRRTVARWARRLPGAVRQNGLHWKFADSPELRAELHRRAKKRRPQDQPS